MGCSTIRNKEAGLLITVEDIQEIWFQLKKIRNELTDLKAQFDLIQTKLTNFSFKLTDHINTTNDHEEGQPMDNVLM